MKTTQNSLLLKANQKQTTRSNVDMLNADMPMIDRTSVIKSARPMKSMVRVKSIRPQRVELRSKMRKRVVKL